MRYIIILLLAGVFSGCFFNENFQLPEESLPVPNDGSIIFLVIGDYGVGGTLAPPHRQILADNLSAMITQLDQEFKLEFILTTGDNAYTYDAGAGENLDILYPNALDPYFRDWIDMGLFIPTVGNHDRWVGVPFWQGYDAFSSYFDRSSAIIQLESTHSSPTPQEVGFPAQSGNNLVFDIIISNTHILGLNTDPVGNNAYGWTQVWPTEFSWLATGVTAQYAWVDSMLTNCDPEHNHIIAGHHTPWSSATKSLEATHMRWNWARPEWDVDGNVWGHAHVFENVKKDGIHHVTIGSSGFGSNLVNWESRGVEEIHGFETIWRDVDDNTLWPEFGAPMQGVFLIRSSTVKLQGTYYVWNGTLAVPVYHMNFKS